MIRVRRNVALLNFAFALDEVQIYNEACGKVF